jgi:hypothetical protein
MCGMEPFKGSTPFFSCLLNRSLDEFFFNVLGFLEEFEKSWKSICVFQKCVQNARNSVLKKITLFG